MMPAPQQLASPRRLMSGMLAASLGMLALAVLFLPSRNSVTHALAIEWRPSAELAALFFLVAMAALAAPRFAARRAPAIALALLVTAAALLNLADAATPALLGRDLNLYWDLRHLPSLLGLARESAGWWRFSVAAALVVGAVLTLVATVSWIWRRVLIALSDRRIA